ncbi:MAG: hypothetical protein FJX60_07370 [Alphaproteobacteria bacterium]|nr:hypothetical protein [Alphaproteobacteria bacterium]
MSKKEKVIGGKRTRLDSERDQPKQRRKQTAEEFRRRAAYWRAKTSGRIKTDSADLIREDRDRR